MENLPVSVQMIERRIYLIRGQKVMLDRDLAELYEVQTKVLNKAVKRNIERFPADFMFRLDKKETQNWRLQFGTSNSKMGLRHHPYVFTEHGVAMLSSVLRSKRAIEVNIEIMRTFSKLRELLATHKDLVRKLEDMERKYDIKFKVVFDAIKALMKTQVTSDQESQKKIGFEVEK